MNSSVFVINLARSTERRRDIEKNLNECKINYQITPAVDGAALTEQEQKQHTRAINYAITNGELGCALSHINIYRYIVEHDIASALILEDDASIPPHASNVIETLERQIDESKPCIVLLTKTQKYLKKPTRQITGEYALHKVLEAQGTHGYLINKKAAEALLAFLYPVWLVADKWNVIYEYGISDIYSVKPILIETSIHESDSTIQKYTNEERAQIVENKRKIWEQLKKKRSLRIKLRILKLKIANAFRAKVKG
ncbi:glycosyltransferase family 25 protein [Mixta intestinalis]|uniref:Glycosyl transferase family 25 domain-containing protein n=1 Tax=Mixta intestinalis TaxID=1615494 RepID=A0A6P1PZ26_9GAMM|nr:glycosyltransferase family 25 protein [Mixta intestinalis]QHM71264.1 hypothetical protein C7M51_01550 [Mixta intestinalis]